MKLSKTLVHAALTVLLSAPLALAFGGTMTGTASVQTNGNGRPEVVLRSDGTAITFKKVDCDAEDWDDLVSLARQGRKVRLTIEDKVIKTVEEVD
ncbi:MAG: hypothetical protein HY812_05020 [Planctomycetes bacterium]|nr:hypothetical protein [Planctomycetota bacterium]